MTWVGWMAIGIAVFVAVMDWLIVMGANPRNWKGGSDPDEPCEYSKERR